MKSHLEFKLFWVILPQIPNLDSHVALSGFKLLIVTLLSTFDTFQG